MRVTPPKISGLLERCPTLNLPPVFGPAMVGARELREGRGPDIAGV